MHHAKLCLPFIVLLAAPAVGAQAAAESLFPFAERAAAWLEGETAEAGAGHTVNADSRLASVTSGGRALKLSVAGAGGALNWQLTLAQPIAQPELVLRRHGESEAWLSVSADGRMLGTVVLPRTRGKGHELQDWQWTSIRLPGALIAGRRQLRLEFSGKSPVMLDCLMLVEANCAFPAGVETARLETSQQQAGPLQLPPWATPAGWSRVAEMESSRNGRVFYDDQLPAHFVRSLVIGAGGWPKSEVSWIFTGPRAGLTVAIRSDAVELTARSYDSTGLIPEGLAQAPRFPEAKRLLARVRIAGGLQAVTLTLNHRASAELSLNGQLVWSGVFAEDLSRHQLRTTEKTLPWHVQRPLSRAATISVSPELKHQRLLGWGGITSIPSYHMLSARGRAEWWRLLCEYGFNIQREYPAGRTLKHDYSNLGSLEAAIHHTYADNFPNGETVDFEYLRLHRLLPDSAVWFEYWWQQPPWTIDQPEAFALSVIEYCRRAKATAGRGPEIVGVQNEHLAKDWDRQLHALRRHLDAAGFGATRLHMNDGGMTHVTVDWLKKYRADADAWRVLDFTATHQYDYQKFFTNPDGFDPVLREWRQLSGEKPFLSTELCVNSHSWQFRSYRVAFVMAQQYHKTLTLADAVALCYCWLLLDTEQPSFMWTRSLFAVDRENGFVPVPSSHQLRCYGAYSRRIRSGMVRVAARADLPDLLATAYVGEGGKATVVMINRSTEPLDVALRWPGIRFDTIERASPTQANEVGPFPESASAVSIAPGSIVTLTNVPLQSLPEGFPRDDSLTFRGSR